MELHQALRHVIKTDGPNILTDSRLINILSDLNAYQDIQGAKYTLRAIIDEGFAERFCQVGSYNERAAIMIHRFAKTTGFNEDSVNYICNAIAFGLGWINQMPAKPMPAPYPIPKPQPESVSNLNLSRSQLEKKSEAFQLKYSYEAEEYLDSIITIIGGDPKQDLGISLSANVSFSASYNCFDLNLEFEGTFKCSVRYNITFVAIIKSTTGKIMSKCDLYLDKSEIGYSYFVKALKFSEADFHNVCEIVEIRIYWIID